ncbi:hypothetical protein D3Y57_19375 [Sphingomonas paeninsulae]|uniref:Uncharacterized protein n=1 Tax=Sphingomonas paeninsulae TaxID=2319844 RepID=A0A494TEI5_SPHPE|nr:hypothetical protein D3Y57_19375 [Sphingomonas paeninsulae]
MVAVVLLTVAPVGAVPLNRNTLTVATQAPYFPVVCEPRHLSKSFVTFSGIHSAKRGELIVPPHDYATGLQPPDTREGGSDRIYDIAFLDVDRDGIILEVRGYSGDDLTNPKISRIASFAVGANMIQLRHIVITIKATSALGITYSVGVVPAMARVATQDISHGTEVIDANYCRRDGLDIVVPISTR